MCKRGRWRFGPTAENNGDGTATSDADESGAEASAEAQIEIVGIDHPDEVEAGEEFQFEVTAENTGDSTGQWTDTVSARIGDSD